MALTEAWCELHRTRLPELPLDCGNVRDPGVIYSEDIRDWSDKATTPDQLRIERYIDHYDLRSARVLHVGIGNSSFAQRFRGRVKEIVGTTIDEPEMQVARSLALPNYSFVLHNKFAGKDDMVEGRFHFILDNNPTSPCCCVRHLSDLFEFYVKKLAPDGQIVTDSLGLGWVPENSNPRWGFNFNDLEAAGAAAGLSLFRTGRSVYVLSRLTPPVPGLASRSRHIVRRVAALPGRIVRVARRTFAKATGKALSWVSMGKTP